MASLMQPQNDSCDRPCCFPVKTLKFQLIKNIFHPIRVGQNNFYQLKLSFKTTESIRKLQSGERRFPPPTIFFIS